MDYTVVRSRRRTMALEITRDARVLVRAPYRTADAAIRRFVDAHQQWIDTHLTRRQDYLASHPAPTEAPCASGPRRTSPAGWRSGQSVWGSPPPA